MTQQVQMIEPAEPEGRGFASRKWLLALLMLALSSGLLWGGRIGEAAWVEVSVWTLGLYMAGNGLSAFAAVWGRR